MGLISSSLSFSTSSPCSPTALSVGWKESDDAEDTFMLSAQLMGLLHCMYVWDVAYRKT